MSKKSRSESPEGKIIVFGAKQIRRAWMDEQWFFSVVDIVAALTDSPNPRNYWNMMKARERGESGVQLSTFCVQLKLTSADGKAYALETVNNHGGNGRWAFLEAADPCDAKNTIQATLKG